MKDEKGISLNALLILILIGIILIFLSILVFKIMDTNKTINTSTTISNMSNTTTTNEMISTDISVELRPEFKQAMDSYEAVMDEYIAFMIKYNASKGTNPELITAYGEYMKKYIDATDAFKKWDGKEMNKEEAKYYVDVQTRVTQKLMNASIDMSYQ